MMRILILSPKPPWPPFDGGAVATGRCIEGLAAGGAEISVLAMRTEKHITSPESAALSPGYLKYYETVSVSTAIRPLKLMANLLFSSEPYDILRFRSVHYAEALQSLLLREQFDIIQCEGLLYSFYIGLIRGLTNAPVVLRAHNVEHRIREMMAEAATTPVERDYLKILSRRLKRREILAARQFDAVIPISEPDYQWYKSVAEGTPVMLSETGAGMPPDIDTPDDGSLKVGFIGSLNWQPNLDALKWFLTSVWPCILRSLPDARFHIAGIGVHPDNKRWMAGKNVIFEGEVADARRFAGSMTVLIAPLFAGSGLRIKILEAMSLGRTIVATPVAVDGLPVQDRRELLIAGDAATFCNAVINALTDPALRASTGEKAKELVHSRYDNVEQTGRLLAFYKTLCDGR